MKYEEKEQEQYADMQVGDFQYAAVQEEKALPARPAGKKKSPLMVAGSLVVAGAAIMAVGIAGAGHSHSHYDTDTPVMETTFVAEEYEPLGNAEIIDMTGVTGVNIVCNAGEVQIVSGDSFSVENTSNVLQYSRSVTDGVMAIEYGFKSDDNIFDNNDGMLYITVPNVIVDNFDVTVNLGTASVSDIYGSNMSITLNAGGLSVKNIKADNTTFKVNAGEATFEDCTAESLTTLIAGGEVQINDVVSADLTINASGGECTVNSGNADKLSIVSNASEVEYNGGVESGADIEASMGDVTLNLNRSAGEYDINEKSSKMSEISVNGDYLYDFVKNNHDGTIPINISASMSDISING